MPHKQKVFGIGFHKTATTSLAVALYILGYNVTGYFGVHASNIPDDVNEDARYLANRFDAAQDTPWPILYKELDQWYPGSKFILTIRPKEKWINSINKHFKNHYIPMHEWIYGVKTAANNESVYIRRYEEHNREVVEYFANRPHDLLVMDITKGDGWEKLCPFLGVDIPTIDFPRSNTAQEKSKRIIKRGIKFLKKKTGLYDPKENELMRKGVSATFVRDIFHYHDSMNENLWREILHLSPAEFEQETPISGCSVHDLLTRQFIEEDFWFRFLKQEVFEGNKISLSKERQTKDDLFNYWRNRRSLMREFIANLTDEDCNAKLEARSEYVWEVIIHLMNFGTQQRSYIRQTLNGKINEFEEQSFISFYH